MTIGIAAITTPDGYIIAVTDTRVSFGGWHPADDRGIPKMFQLTSDGMWNAMFAGPIDHCRSVIARIKADLGNKESVPASEVTDVAERAYTHVLRDVWAKSHIVQFDYSGVSDFIDRGLQNLGAENYDRLIKGTSKNPLI